MKIKQLLFILFILGLAACKKDNSATTAQASILQFDIDGVHHSFNIDTAHVTVIDTGASAGKSLTLFTGYGGLPQVRLIITDRTFDRANTCFPLGFYPNILSSAACNDTIPNTFCLGFLMQYTDTGFGHIATLGNTDSVSTLTLVSCSGTPAALHGTFNCILTDPTGATVQRTITNGKFSNIIYTR